MHCHEAAVEEAVTALCKDEDLSGDTRGHAKMNPSFACLEMQRLLSSKLPRKLYELQDFDTALEFDNSHKGQCCCIEGLGPATVSTHPEYVPDCIIRSQSRASTVDSWPKGTETSEEEASGMGRCALCHGSALRWSKASLRQ